MTEHSKKDDACRFYRDPLRIVDFICSKTVIRFNIFEHQN